MPSLRNLAYAALSPVSRPSQAKTWSTRLVGNSIWLCLAVLDLKSNHATQAGGDWEFYRRDRSKCWKSDCFTIIMITYTLSLLSFHVIFLWSSQRQTMSLQSLGDHGHFFSFLEVHKGSIKFQQLGILSIMYIWNKTGHWGEQVKGFHHIQHRLASLIP